MGCKNVMVYVETAEGKPVNVGLEMLTAAKEIAEKVTAVVIGAADAAATTIACGADGIMVEVHNNPSCALCDGAQSITPAQFTEVNQKIVKVREAIR